MMSWFLNELVASAQGSVQLETCEQNERQDDSSIWEQWFYDGH